MTMMMMISKTLKEPKNFPKKNLGFPPVCITLHIPWNHR